MVGRKKQVTPFLQTVLVLDGIWATNPFQRYTLKVKPQILLCFNGESTASENKRQVASSSKNSPDVADVSLDFSQKLLQKIIFMIVLLAPAEELIEESSLLFPLSFDDLTQLV